MDLTPTPTTSPDTDNETPPQIQPIKPLAFTNGALKKHHHHQLQQSPPVVVTYGECLKNHAASLGGHALDGCGEFMPSFNASASNPTSLKCAACGCHRNFHRREDDSTLSFIPTITHFLNFHQRQLPPPPRISTSPSPPPPTAKQSYAPQMLLTLGTANPEDHPAMNNHAVATPVTPTAAKAENPSGRKRFRTRFSQEQKEKMLLFSEKLGWKMQKGDEEVVEKFCNEINIRKSVLKVWMHNNKSTFGKRNIHNKYNKNNNGSNIHSNGGVNFESSGNKDDDNRDSHYDNENNGVNFHVSIDGSSSSS